MPTGLNVGSRHSLLSGLTIGDDHPQYARRIGAVISGGLTVTGGITSDCPVVITGDCTNVLQVKKASGAISFTVDTVNDLIKIPNTTQLSFGGGGSYTPATYGFVYNDQRIFEVEGNGETAIYIDPFGGNNMCIFGASFSTGVHSYVFEQSALFKGGFAFDRLEITAAGGTTNLSGSGRVTYVAYTGTGPHTITLPPPTNVPFGSGCKPGAIIILKDEILPAGLTQANKVTVSVQGGAQMDNDLNQYLFGGGSFMWISDGFNYHRFN